MLLELLNANQTTTTTAKPVGGTVAAKMRSLVSLNKIRFQEDGFDLDLTYITPRIIAMGFPSHGRESYYRNPVDEVERFFSKRHANHYMVYNLCSERTYDSAGRFGGRYRRYPFDDHNAPKDVAIISDFVRDAAAFLKKDPQNVVSVHCKAGKGRTGLMVACLLMVVSAPSLRHPNAALKFFAEARTNDCEGVTIPSQVRYVYYWDTMLRDYGGRDPVAASNSAAPSAVASSSGGVVVGSTASGSGVGVLTLTRVLLHNAVSKSGAIPASLIASSQIKGGGAGALASDSVYFTISRCPPKDRATGLSPKGMSEVYDSRKGSLASATLGPATATYHNGGSQIMFDLSPGTQGTGGARVSGDFRVDFYCSKSMFGDDEILHFWLNTYLLTSAPVTPAAAALGATVTGVPSSSVTLPKAQVDKACKDKKHKEFPDGMKVEVIFAGLAPSPDVLGVDGGKHYVAADEAAVVGGEAASSDPTASPMSSGAVGSSSHRHGLAAAGDDSTEGNATAARTDNSSLTAPPAKTSFFSRLFK